jgi:hypothetical protein
MVVEKLCGCIRIQQFVWAFTWVTWLLWLAATIMYIPYIVMWSPYELKDPDDPNSRVPGQDYGTGTLSAILITTGLIIDSLLLSGIYIPYKVNTDMLYPWFFFYGVLILGLVGLSLFLGVQLEGQMRLVALGPALLSLVYMFMFWCMVQLFKVAHNKKSVIMEGLNQIVMEPLTERARVVAAAAATTATEEKDENCAFKQD